MSIPTPANLYTQGFGSRPENVEIPFYSNRIPGPQDTQYPIGKVWINMAANAAYILTSQTSQNGITTSTWTVSASPTGAVSTLTGNSGGAVTPTSGNINIVGTGTLAFAGSGSTLTGTITPGATLISTITGDTGGAESPLAGNFNLKGTANQITVTGTANTETWSIPAAFTAPGSITSTTTITSGTGITATTGNIVASAGNISTTVGSISSAATVTAATGLTVTAGGAAITGTTNINTTGAGVTSIGTGGTGATNIGNATGNTAVTGSLTASTTLTATAGAITATNGNVVLGTAGNKLSIATGANASAGTSGAMTAGAVTVNTTAVTANSLIFFSTNTLGTVTVCSSYYVSARTPGTSFTITSSQGTDTSTVNWWLIN